MYSYTLYYLYISDKKFYANADANTMAMGSVPKTTCPPILQ